MRFWQQAASWQDFAALSRGVASSEEALRRKLWRRILREAASLPFLEELLTAHYCAFDRNTPVYVKAVLVGALVYFVVPDHLAPKIPKYFSMIGLADNAAVLGVAFKAVSSHIKPEHRELARRRIARLRGEAPSRA
jgi:uncharacterized membrane protein YkvA (DUF1232 family)